jgi:hypothetical protein
MTRLVLLFGDDSKINLRNNDIIISSESIESNNNKFISIHDFDDIPKKSIIDFDTFLNSINQYSIEYDLLKSALPTFYSNTFRYLRKWINAIEYVFKNFEINEVFINKFYSKNNYLPYYESEGETNNSLFYQKQDFIPNTLFNYLIINKKIEKSKITLNELSKLGLFYRIFFRRYILLLLKFSVQVWYSLTKKTFNKEIKSFDSIFFSRSVVHTSFIKKMVAKNKNAHVLTALPYFSKTSNSEFSNKYLSNKNSSVYDYLSLMDILKSFYIAILRFSSFNKNKFINIDGVNLNLNDLLKEICIYQFDVDVQVIALKKMVDLNLSMSKHNICVYGCEMLTQYPYWINKVFSSYKRVKTVQVQTAAIDNINMPDFFFSDQFLFSNSNNQLFFKTKFNKSKCELLFKGNDSLKTIKNKNPSLKKVLIFSQIHDYVYQLELIELLIKLSVKFKFKLFIKLHPREYRKDILKRIANTNVTLLENSEDVFENIKEYDLCITRVSSITEEIILSGVPVVNFLISTFDLNTSYLPFINKLFVTNIYSKEELENIFKNFKQYYFKYEDFRNQYLKDQGLDKDPKFLTDYLIQNTKF